MKWLENNTISKESIIKVEKKLGITFPQDFVDLILKYDGAYPCPNNLFFDGNEENINNLISFSENDPSYIIDIINETEDLNDSRLIPIAEDPFGNLFCYFFDDSKFGIYFWNHEKPVDIVYICKSFNEFISMIHD